MKRWVLPFGNRERTAGGWEKTKNEDLSQDHHVYAGGVGLGGGLGEGGLRDQVSQWEQRHGSLANLWLRAWHFLHTAALRDGPKPLEVLFKVCVGPGCSAEPFDPDCRCSRIKVPSEAILSSFPLPWSPLPSPPPSLLPFPPLLSFSFGLFMLSFTVLKSKLGLEQFQIYRVVAKSRLPFEHPAGLCVVGAGGCVFLPYPAAVSPRVSLLRPPSTIFSCPLRSVHFRHTRGLLANTGRVTTPP